MTRITWYGLLAFAMLLGCPTSTIDVTPGIDDDAGDDDAGDDDSGSWQWGAVNTDADADASLVGEAPDDWAGCHLTLPGDMNGDGLQDLAIGAFRSAELAYKGGEVYLVFGAESGWSRGESLAGRPSVVGYDEDMELAQTRAVGDLDGDGLADLVIDPGYQNAAPQWGQFLVYGKTAGWVPSVSAEQVDVHLTNLNANGSTDLMSRDAAGDVDGDGVDDWLLYGQVLFQGEAHVVSGASIAGNLEVPDDSACWVHGDQGQQVYVMPVGDINGDGLGDLRGSFQAWSGTYVFLFGRAGPLPHDQPLVDVADTILAGDKGGDLTDLRVVGDVNGDGLRDLAAHATTPMGGTLLFFGRTGWPAQMAASQADVHIAAGQDVFPMVPIGDVDGDGIDDLSLTGPGVSPIDTSDTYVVLGRSDPWPAEIALHEADIHIAPAAGLPYIGSPSWSEQLRGDLDGDGIDDLFLINDHADMDGVVEAGGVFVFCGRTSWPAELTTDDADVTFAGSEIWQSMGQGDWCAVVDLDGDGYDDFLTASYYHPVGTQEGETFIFFGKPRP